MAPSSSAPILIAGPTASGKSALIPFSGWLPRAMEGPTPSSAVFYGALSVHLGAFLMMRFSPLLALSPVLSAVVVVSGLGTAMFSTIVGRVQTDVKCGLVYASLTQVGLIFAEIGLGWDYIPLVHLIGHACFRTLQFLRAPSALLDHAALENAVGRSLHKSSGRLVRLLPVTWQMRLYAFALDRGSWDGWLIRLFVEPFLNAFTMFNSWERRWSDWLNGVTATPRTLTRTTEESP